MFYILILIATIKQFPMTLTINTSYWIYDNINNHTNLRLDSGPATVEFRLKSFTFNYKLIKQFRCYLFRNRQCDPVVIGEMCQVVKKGAWKSEMYSFLNHYITQSSSSCDGFLENFKGWHNVENKSEAFKCSGPDIYWTYNEDVGSCYTDGKIFHTVTYPKIMVAAGMLMKRLFDKRTCITYLYKSHVISDIVKNEWIYKSLLKETTISFRKTTVQLILKYKVDCQANYYFEQCWYKCINTPRSECINGKHVCKDNWGYIRLQYVKPKNDDIIQYECWFIDMCMVETCTSRNSICLPYTNGSKVCTDTNPTYSCGGEPDTYNVTDSIAVISEPLRCTFDVPKEIINRSFTTFCSHSDEGEKRKLIDCKSDVITPLSMIEEGIELKVQCYATFLEGYIFRVYHQILTFAKRAQRVTLFNTSIGFGKSIYVGQSFRCITDGWPAKYFYYTVAIKTDNFQILTPIDNVRGDKNIDIPVPHTAVLGFCMLECNVTNNFKNGRTTKTLKQVFDFGLKSYIYFGWRKEYKNIYLYEEIIDCTFESFIGGVIRLRQFRGMIRMKETKATVIHLKFSYGGDYGFFCILEFQKTSYLYTKRKEFELFQPPRHLCFQLFPSILGSLIQCSSNTYPYDLVQTEIYISDITNENIYAASTDVPYIRIPYDLPINRAHLKCVVEFNYKNISKSLSIDKTIFIRPNFKDQISHDLVSKKCLQYDEILEPEDMFYVGKGIFEFRKPSFMLVPVQLTANIRYPELLSLVIPLISLLMFFMIINSTLIKYSVILLETQISKYSRVAYHRRLNDNLMRKANILSDPESIDAQSMVKEIDNLYDKDPSIFGANFLRQSKIKHFSTIRESKKSIFSDFLKTDPALDSVKSS